MHREGHIGAALVAYAPLGAIVLTLGFETVALLGAVAVAGLCMLPDLDLRVPLLAHRGPTHTVWFTLGVATLLGLLGAVVGWQRAGGVADGLLTAISLGTFAFTLGVAAIGSHLVADALTPAGVRPFAPYDDRRFTYALARANNPLANYGLLALGVATVAVGLGIGNRVGGLLG